MRPVTLERPTTTRRPTLAVWKFASCDGCQLSLLDCEDDLLGIAGAIEIASFPEASSVVVGGPYDVSLVEGSISTPHQLDRIHAVRAASRVLVTIGACATAGGIQALRNGADTDEFVRAVYARPDYVSTLASSTPIADHVVVDLELRGCPIDRGQLLEVLTAYLRGWPIRFPTTPVCTECKRRGVACVLVAEGTPCLGPVTQAGCGAICPAYRRGCYGCFGPAESAARPSVTAALDARFAELGVPAGRRQRMWRGIAGWSPSATVAAPRAETDSGKARDEASR